MSTALFCSIDFSRFVSMFLLFRLSFPSMLTKFGKSEKKKEIDCDRCKKWTNSPLEHKVNLGYNNMCKLHKLAIFLCV